MSDRERRRGDGMPTGYTSPEQLMKMHQVQETPPASNSAFRPVPRRADTERRQFQLRPGVDDLDGSSRQQSSARRSARGAAARSSSAGRPPRHPDAGDDSWLSTGTEVGIGIAVGVAAGGVVGYGLGHALWGGAKATGAAGAAKGAAAGAAAGASPAAAAAASSAAAAAMANIQTLTLVGMGTGGGAGGGLGAVRAHQKLLVDRPPLPPQHTPRRRGQAGPPRGTHHRQPLDPQAPRPRYADPQNDSIGTPRDTSPRPMPGLPRPNAATVTPTRRDPFDHPSGSSSGSGHVSQYPPQRQQRGWQPVPSQHHRDGGDGAQGGSQVWKRGGSAARSSSEPIPSRRAYSQHAVRTPTIDSQQRDGLKPSLKPTFSGRLSTSGSESSRAKSVSFVGVARVASATPPRPTRQARRAGAGA